MTSKFAEELEAGDILHDEDGNWLGMVIDTPTVGEHWVEFDLQVEDRVVRRGFGCLVLFQVKPWRPSEAV